MGGDFSDRSARVQLGIKTVAVFTPGDDSHAEFADERVPLDVEKHGGRAGDAFLDVEAIVKIAKEWVARQGERLLTGIKTSANLYLTYSN